MDAVRFDTLTRVLSHAISRRAVPPIIGGLLAGVSLGSDPSGAKKKKKKKTTFCLDGQTVKASKKKKKKKLLKRGATPGACPASPPPPVCTPTCSGTTCGGDDGCGGVCGCPAGSLCHGDICQACTIACLNANHVCDGTALQATLAGGGTVYVCPGRYTGTFTPGSGSIIGAGDGDDPASSTILDANRNGRVMQIDAGRTVSLHGLRLTGGFDDSVTASGGGVLNQGTLTMTDCTITDNEVPIGIGGGISALAPLTLTRCQILRNKAFSGGGIYASSGTTTLVRSVVSQNEASQVGGGIQVNGATVLINDGSIVSDNTAADGGGIFELSGTVTLNGSTVSGNEPNNCRPVASVPNCMN